MLKSYRNQPIELQRKSVASFLYAWKRSLEPANTRVFHKT